MIWEKEKSAWNEMERPELNGNKISPCKRCGHRPHFAAYERGLIIFCPNCKNDGVWFGDFDLFRRGHELAVVDRWEALVNRWEEENKKQEAER